MPELHAENMEELIDGIKQALKEDAAKEKRAVSREKMFSDKKADGCRKLYEKCLQLAALK